MPVTLLCHYCPKSYVVPPSQASESRYCSRACKYAAQRTKVPRICLGCSVAFLAFPAEIKRGGGKYCSQRCWDSIKRHTPEQIWDLVAICAHGRDCPYCCWPYQGTLNNGYGLFYLDGIPHYAHRFVWEQWHQKPMPPELFGAHYCHFRACVSPSHIHPATQKENLADSSRDFRMSHGEAHHKAKLVEADIPRIFTWAWEGNSYRKIA